MTELQIQKSEESKLLPSLKSRGMDIRSFRVIKNILYPNAANDETILMALDYCKARNLDIMKRPIQIVPIWNSKTKRLEDTIWASITEIRTTATRTGCYAGKDEAEFGEEITEDISGKTVTYPKWCKVTVYRMVSGTKCAFATKLLWKESFKIDKKTGQPNKMWSGRSFGQLEKCTEAASLRSAFPEEVGSDYIAEEAFDVNEGQKKNVKQTQAYVPKDENLSF